MDRFDKHIRKIENRGIVFDASGFRREYDYDDKSLGAFMDFKCTHENNFTLQFFILVNIFIFGIIFNAVVIWMILALREYKKTAPWYILQLAIADSLFLMMLPLRISDELKGKWIYSSTACHIYNGIFYVNYYASIFFLTIWIGAMATAIPVMIYSDGRMCHCAFSFPTSDEDKCEHFLGKSHINMTCEEYLRALADCKIWMGPALKVGCITCGNDPLKDYTGDPENDDLEYVFGYYNEHNNITYHDASNNSTVDMANMKDISYENCKHPSSYYHRRWIYTNFVFAFVLPVLIMTVCYGCILWRVTHPKIRRGNASFSCPSKQANSSSTEGSKSGSILSGKKKTNSTSSSTPRTRSNHRITVIVVVLVASFIVCWLPFQTLQLALIKGISTDFNCQMLTTISQHMAYFNSVLNPFLYTFLSSNFVKRFREAWRGTFGGRAVYRNGSRTSKLSSSRGYKVSHIVTGKCTKESDISDTSTAVSGNPQLTIKLLPSENDSNKTSVFVEMQELNYKK